jgi:hypothetical protein
MATPIANQLIVNIGVRMQPQRISGTTKRAQARERALQAADQHRSLAG